MTEALIEAGVDPDYTPVDRLPIEGSWALVRQFNEDNGIDNEE